MTWGKTVVPTSNSLNFLVRFNHPTAYRLPQGPATVSMRCSRGHTHDYFLWSQGKRQVGLCQRWAQWVKMVVWVCLLMCKLEEHGIQHVINNCYGNCLPYSVVKLWDMRRYYRNHKRAPPPCWHSFAPVERGGRVYGFNSLVADTHQSASATDDM